MFNNLINKFFGEYLSVLGRNIKNDFRSIERDYKKVMRVIRSCKCEEHLDATNKLITLFYIKHRSEFLLKNLKKRLRIKKKFIYKI